MEPFSSNHSVLVRAAQRREDRALAYKPRRQPGLRRLGRAGQRRRSDQEHLGESDRGIILLRRRMLEEAHKVERGEEPKALVRDPAPMCVPSRPSTWKLIVKVVRSPTCSNRLSASTARSGPG